jgi:hypothetical protein
MNVVYLCRRANEKYKEEIHKKTNEIFDKNKSFQNKLMCK